MARVKHEEEVPLLGPRGQPCGRGRTLAHHDDYGRLRHGGKGDALDHEGEASSRGSGHRSRAGKGGAYGHVDCCDLILRLFYDNAPFRRLLGHEGEHARRGRHGVAGVEPAAGQDGAEAHGRIPVDQHVWGAPRAHLKGALFAIALGKVMAPRRRAPVLIDGLRPFLAHELADHLKEGFEPHLQKPQGGTGGYGVHHDPVPAAARGQIDERHVQETGPPMFLLDQGRIVEDEPSFGEPRFVVRDAGPVEGDDDVYPLPRCGHGLT